MAKKKGSSTAGTSKEECTPKTTDLKIGISVLHGKVEFDIAKGNGYSKRGDKKIRWTITRDYEFKLDFNLLPCAGLGGSTVWPFDSPAAVDGNSTGWVTDFKGDPGEPGVYKYDVLVRVKGTEGTIAREDPVIIVGRV